MKIIKDICYNDKDQLLDLLLPENDVSAVLVFFHGGGIVEGCKEWNRVPFEYLTSKNIAVASANYRMYPEAKFPDFIEDASDAVAWVFNNIKNYCNCDKIFVGGSSAGGYIDYEKPWWYSNYIDETEVDETHTYLLAGEASPSVILFSSMMILNTDMLVEQNIDVNDIYQTVLEGEWTHDEMSELVAGQYRDKNGNGERDLDDIYGFSTHTRSDVEHFLIAAGVRACSTAAASTSLTSRVSPFTRE